MQNNNKELMSPVFNIRHSIYNRQIECFFCKKNVPRLEPKQTTSNAYVHDTKNVQVRHFQHV